MYCSDGFGFGGYWHYGNSLFILILLVGVAVLAYRLIMHNGNRTLTNSVVANNFHTAIAKNHCPSCRANIEETYLRCPECNYKIKSNCPSCDKIIKTDWVVCPYCETKLK